MAEDNPELHARLQELEHELEVSDITQRNSSSHATTSMTSAVRAGLGALLAKHELIGTWAFS